MVAMPTVALTTNRVTSLKAIATTTTNAGDNWYAEKTTANIMDYKDSTVASAEI